MKQLGILGYVSDLISIITELAEDASGFKDFHVLLNQTVDPNEGLIKSNLLNLKFHDLTLGVNSFDVNANYPFAFGVVGTNSKPIVFNWFESRLNINKASFINLIHSTCYVSPSAELTYGLQLEPMSLIAAGSRIGFGVNIKRSCSIGHHVNIGDYATINPGVVVCGRVNIGKQTVIGAGSVISDGVNIGNNVVIGAGSLVLKDIPSDSKAFGSPAIPRLQ